MAKLIKFNRKSCLAALNVCISKFRADPIFDTRYYIAAGIISCIINNCSYFGADCPSITMKALIDNVVNAIPANVRWKTFNASKSFGQWLITFDPQKAGQKDFKLLNDFEELFLGIVSFTDMEMRDKKKVEKVFRRYIIDLGLQDYDHFNRAFSFLFDMEERLETEPKLYGEKEIERLEQFIGIKKGALILGEEQVNNIKLGNLQERIIPIYFGGRAGVRVGLQRQSLSGVNIPQRLCYGLKQPREEIIEGAYKGTIFEDFLSNVLQGNIVVAIQPDSPIDGFTQRVDDLEKLPGGKELAESLKKNRTTIAWETIAGGYEYYISENDIPPEKTNLTRSYAYFSYDYSLPLGQTTCQLKITEETHPSFKEFLSKQKTVEWEEDILLLHNTEPKHCLIAQAKFTLKYNHSKYVTGKNHVLATVNYVDSNPAAKRELNIPEGMTIVPALFTSYTGAIHKSQDEVLKTTIFPLLRDQFFTKVVSMLQ